ncbi:MAG TPA: hypothetical protein VHX60_12490 [Acidobacteriaceae bacterium]|nr:hypothetical protein [Acidobacteriaceae bacterium]
MQTAPPLALAWQHTGEFWAQTGAAIAHHPFAILACAAVPAAERGYVLGQRQPPGRGQLALMEFVVTLWRIFLLAVAIWVACTGHEWNYLSSRVGAAGAWQVALGMLGVYFARHLRMLLWELLFLAVALLLGATILRWIVRAMAPGVAWLRDPHHQKAMRSVLRNLILAPVLVIYLVEMARPVFR